MRIAFRASRAPCGRLSALRRCGQPVATTFSRAFSEETTKYKKDFPFTGLGHMGEIRNANKELPHSAYKLSRPITISELKAQGYRVDTPVREYYSPPHWKHGKTHLLISLEFDGLHAWATPPDNKPFPPSPLATLTPEQMKEKWPYFVPMLQKQVVVEDDWVLTDIHTFFTDTPVWVIPGLEKFLNVKLHAEGTPEFDGLKTELDDKELEEDEAGWVGPQFFRSCLDKYEGKKDKVEQQEDVGIALEEDPATIERAQAVHEFMEGEMQKFEKEEADRNDAEKESK